MNIINLILGIVFISLSVLGYIFKPFTYWMIASIISGLVGLLFFYLSFKSKKELN